MGNGMMTELPKLGQVLNYVYLFRHEAGTRDEGVKDRPVVVIDVNETSRRVTVLPVTSQGERYKDAVPIPEDVARAANLRPPSAILVSEYNIFTWLGFDLRPLATSGGYVIGRLPPGFTAKIRTLVATARPIERD
jgi:PemK-like, MazF-like toxin of type II toxin-antitoxin system